VLPFDKVRRGPWSRKDDNGRLDITTVESIKIGVAVRGGPHVKLALRDLRWVRFCAGPPRARRSMCRA